MACNGCCMWSRLLLLPRRWTLALRRIGFFFGWGKAPICAQSCRSIVQVLKLLLVLDGADMLISDCTLHYLPILCAGDLQRWKETSKWISAMPSCWRSSHAFVLASFRNEVKTNKDVAMPLCWDKAVATPLCWNAIIATPLCWDTNANHTFVLEHFRNEEKYTTIVTTPLCWDTNASHTFVLEQYNTSAIPLCWDVTFTWNHALGWCEYWPTCVMMVPFLNRNESTIKSTL